MTRLLWAGAFLSVIFYLVAEWSNADGQTAPPSGTHSDLRRDQVGNWSVDSRAVAPLVIGWQNVGPGYALVPELG